MRCLDIVRMVISSCPSHAFGPFVVWHDVVVVGELFVADCTFPILLDDFSVQELPHLCGRPELSISPRVVRIFDVLDTKPGSAFLTNLLATAAEVRSVNRTVFIPTEFHGNAPG